MLWERIALHWEELAVDACDRWDGLTTEDIRAINGNLAAFVAVIRRHTGMTEEDATVAIAMWAGDLSEVNLEPFDEAARHAGRDDVHEQRERDQECEGMLHWPPHVGMVHHGRVPARR